jgi:hypothetical protein
VRQLKVMFLQPREDASRLPARPPCSLVSGLVGFWAINLPEIPWLLGELALPTQQIKFYISTYLLSFVLSLAEFSLVGVAKEAEIGGVVK